MRGPIGAPGIEPGIWLRPRLPIVVGGAFRCVQWPVRAQKRPANGRNNRRAWSAPQRTLRPPMAPLRPHPSCPLERPLGIPLERPLDIPRISLNVATCGAHFDMAYPHGGRAISPPALSFSVLSLFHFLSFSAIFFFFFFSAETLRKVWLRGSKPSVAKRQQRKGHPYHASFRQIRGICRGLSRG